VTDSATPAAGNQGEAVIREGAAADIPAIEPLWKALYEHQASHGLLVSVPPDGFAKWQAGIAGTLGRFSCLIIAERAGVPIGFVAGRVRPHPPYLGGQAAGYLGEVFVDQEARGASVGRRLLDATIAWFAKRDVRRVELNVIPGNREGLAFYERLGWVEEHRQLVWNPWSHPDGHPGSSQR
jgi:GNAT superfamily N-acetyltransferase